MPAKLAILIAGLVGFALVHSVLASSAVRRAGERRLGSSQRYRLAYSVVAVLILFALLVATRGEYPMVWRAEGVARGGLLLVQGIAAVGFLLTVRSFRVGEFLGLRARGTAEPGAVGDRLTGGRFRTDGMYARCRHPLYFFTGLFFSAWPVMDLRTLVLAIWLWAYAYVGSFLEERKLVADLGEGYVAYQARTPRLLPFGRPSRAGERMRSE